MSCVELSWVALSESVLYHISGVGHQGLREAEKKKMFIRKKDVTPP